MATDSPSTSDLTGCGLAAEVSVWQTPEPGGPGRLVHRLVIDPRCLTISFGLGRPTKPTIQHINDDCRCGDYTTRLTVPS